MQLRPGIRNGLAIGVALSTLGWASGQDARGRKYKAPPDTSHIEVTVLKDTNKKPILNAAVIFHATKDGHDEGNLQVKTNEEGKAVIDVIATGSTIDVQVIADGFATFAETYQVPGPERAIEVHMLKPRAQISTYVDNRGQAAQRPMGLQEPNKPSAPATPSPTQTPQSTTVTGTPDSGMTINTAPKPSNKERPSPLDTNPANVHPDNQYPVDPATAPKTPPSQTTPPQAN